MLQPRPEFGNAGLFHASQAFGLPIAQVSRSRYLLLPVTTVIYRYIGIPPCDELGLFRDLGIHGFFQRRPIPDPLGFRNAVVTCRLSNPVFGRIEANDLMGRIYDCKGHELV